MARTQRHCLNFNSQRGCLLSDSVSSVEHGGGIVFNLTFVVIEIEIYWLISGGD